MTIKDFLIQLTEKRSNENEKLSLSRSEIWRKIGEQDNISELETLIGSTIKEWMIQNPYYM